MRSCFVALTSASGPVLYDLPTAGGVLRLEAQSIQVSVESNFVHFSHVTVTEPDGSVLGAINDVILENAIPESLTGYHKPVLGQVSGVSVRIVRLKNGTLDFERFLPARTQTTTEIPYSVRLVNGVRNPIRVNLVDTMGSTAWRSSARVSTLTVQGAGQRWIASATAEVDTVGSAALELRKDPDTGLSIDGTIDAANLVPLARHIVDLPSFAGAREISNFAATSLAVRGPIRLFMPNDGHVTFEAAVQAEATDFAYRDEFVARTAAFKGILTGEGLEGTLHATSDNASIDYTGGFSWGREAVVGGSLNASVTNSESAPKVLQRFLPKNLSFQNALFSGWLDYSRQGSIQISGNVQAAGAKYASEELDSPRIDLAASSQRVALNLVSATWEGSPVHGALNFQPQTRALEGLLVADAVPLARIAARTGLTHVSGSSDVRLLLTGTGADPDVAIRANGTAEAIVKGRPYQLGDVVVAAEFANGLLTIDRVSVRGPNGIATARGSWNQQSKVLNVDLVGNGIPLSILGSRLTGNAAFAGKLTGQSTHPIANGRLEVYDASFEDQPISLALADISADQTSVHATSIQAFRGATRVTGNLSYNFGTEALAGTGEADDIRLGDILKDDVAGTARVTNAKIGGTLKRIQVTGLIGGKNIVADGVRVSDVEGTFSFDGDKGSAQGKLLLPRGSITGEGGFDLSSRAGTFSGKGTGIDLTSLASLVPAGTNLSGAVDLGFSGDFDKKGLRSLSASGELQNVAVNAVPLGAGPFTVAEQNQEWTGSISVGDLERYLDLENVSYDPLKETLHAEIAAHSVSLGNLLSTARPYIASNDDSEAKRAAAKLVLPSATIQQLNGLEGNLDAAAKIDGSLKDPALTISTLTASNLTVQGQPSGTAQASGALAKGVWSIGQLTWNGGPGNVSLSGTIDPHGDAVVNGSVSKINSQWLALFAPQLAKFNGQPDLTFAVSGPARSPNIDAKLNYLEGAPGASDRRQIALDALIKQGQITATGNYFYDGFAGAITAGIPFQYPATIPQDGNASIGITLPQRQLSDLATLLPGIDTTRSQGSIGGQIKIQGPFNKLRATGEADLIAPTLAAKGAATYLKDANAQLVLAGTALNLTASATGSQGGSVSIAGGQLELGNFVDIFSKSLDTILDNPVAGEMRLDNLRVIEKGVAPMNALFAGDVNISGKLREPQVKGQVSLLQGSASVPNAPPAGQATIQPKVNPKFDVAFAMPNPITVNAGLGQFQLTGSGSLGGSFSLPVLNAQLVVDKGTIRLPASRIGIDPGGTIQILYQATPYGAPIAQANVDVTGSTALTANPYGNIIQRYDISLQMRGDLLSAKGLDISAQSSPPDLDQDRILMMLGQGGIFQQQALANSEPYRPDQQVTQAVYTALPFLFDPFTQQLANGVGLDYLDIEYNSLEGIAVTAAKSLGPNLVLSARRQISQPLPGYPLDWDLRLSYRLPLRGKIYRNLNLILDTDQVYPYRIGLEYGFRF